MITSINNSKDCRQALNENLHGLLTGKRKPLVVKEVNNTIGKILCDVKMEMLNREMIGDRSGMEWYGIIDVTRQVSNTKKKLLQ